MTPLAILAAIADQGVTVRVDGRALVLRPKGVASPQLRAELKAHKAAVRALLDPEWGRFVAAAGAAHVNFVAREGLAPGQPQQA